MKKLLAIIMCVALLVSLAACGGEKPENNGANGDVNGGTETIETTEPVKKEVSRGTISGDVYTNDFVGFSFTKNAEWKYLSDEEIAQTINVGQDVVDLNLLEEALVENATIYDMVCMDDYGNSVMVCYENTKLTAFRELSADEYMDFLDDGLANVDGMSYTQVSTDDATLGETTFKKAVYSVTTNGVTISQAYYVKVIDQYAVSIIVTESTEAIETMEAMFG